MSDSRLGKFIYAICSMDVSDLPVPLSRIEKLWNCLITGETPDFEPISRNEKYLMAMLDRYDISNLPAPMSRGEKLLYKIAVGETDLSDVPGYLSRYEELLKYLIENSGISGGDFEYVLYTLNQSLHTLYTTAEKPVKSAILKGQTLVNRITSQGFGGNDQLYESRLYEQPFNTGDIFTVFVVNPNVTTVAIGFNNSVNDSWLGEKRHDVPSNKKITVTVPSDAICKYIGVVVPNRNDSTGFENSLVVVEGDQTHLNVDTYFEGMQSVRMPVLTTIGKNLFDKTKITTDKLITGTGAIITSTNNAFTDYIPVEAGKTYIRNIAAASIAVYDTDKNFIERTKAVTTFSATANGYIRWNFNSYASVLDTMQIEEGSTKTSYEPHKSNILTVNEDVTLRSNGDVYDELNLLTGRLTQRIDENNEVLAQEVVKTVDLTVVNQDNQPTQLGTFENVTHVSLEAENLIPEVEMEVATRISTELASASPLMDDISTNQQQLETTVDEQSNNVDATMIAITEIFEETL